MYIQTNSNIRLIIKLIPNNSYITLLKIFLITTLILNNQK
jgi:hypothetical protein